MSINVIDRFKDDYEFMSNFVPVEVRYPADADYTYPSVEHAYQAAKTLDPEKRVWIRSAETAGQAKKRGNDPALWPRAGWQNIRLAVMENLLRQKFSQEPFRSQLLATGDAHLVEGNTWHDQFWGDCRCEQHVGMGGLNHLGRLLMEIRDEIRA